MLVFVFNQCGNYHGHIDSYWLNLYIHVCIYIDRSFGIDLLRNLFWYYTNIWNDTLLECSLDDHLLLLKSVLSMYVLFFDQLNFVLNIVQKKQGRVWIIENNILWFLRKLFNFCFHNIVLLMKFFTVWNCYDIYICQSKITSCSIN